MSAPRKRRWADPYYVSSAETYVRQALALATDERQRNELTTALQYLDGCWREPTCIASGCREPANAGTAVCDAHIHVPSGGVFVNASTPEHRPPHDRRRPLADAPTRVEEPAGEPEEREWAAYDAGAADERRHTEFYERIACDCVEDPFSSRVCPKCGRKGGELPVPVGDETEALRYQERQADEWRDRAFAALESLKVANDNTESLRAFLTQMLDPAWWREKVDVNGEYTTTRERGYYDCAREIRAALADSGEAGS